jgi:AcrR family transcriptional regulator
VVVRVSAQQDAPVRRRPRDRKQQIVTAATTLFHRHGYGNVGTGDIAAKVGISPGALYRHFPSKQDILRQVMDDMVAGAVVPVAEEDGDLEQLIARLYTVLGPRRDLGVLWHREARHLEQDHRDLTQQRLEGFLAETAAELAMLRPELSRADAALLAWFVVSTLSSPSYHAVELPTDQESDLLRRCALAVATTPMATSARTEAPTAAAGLVHLSRREAIVAAATRLFFEHGYRATTMEDVGAAVGVSGAAVYKHFSSKSDLLGATISRAAEPLQLGLTRALGASHTARDALTRVLDEYIEFATVHHHLVGILVSEVTNLPDALRHNVRRQQADYVAEWVRLLRQSRPGLDAPRARYIVQAVLTTVNDATRIDQVRSHPDLVPRLRQVGLRLLDVE